MSETRFNPWWALAVVCMGQFMVILDATVTNVALPSIQADLGISDSSLQWIVNAYTLLFGGFLLLGGRAADLIGRRTLFLAGVTLFSLASLACALAPSEEFLIVSRGLQGLGGALLSPAALAVITTSFAEGPDRTKALSVWAAIATGGSAAGLLLGGVITEALSWEWVFLINVPVGIGIALAALRLVPNTRTHAHGRHFDLAGAISVTAGLVVLVYAIVKAEAWGWGSTETLGLAGVALGLLALFVLIERRSPAPLVRLSLLRMRSLASANAILLVTIGGMFAMFFFISLYMQNILGYTALETGFAFLPVTLSMLVGATIAQQLISRIGVRTVMAGGLAIGAAGMATLAALTAVDGNYLRVLAGLVPIAVGMGMAFVSATLVATTGVDRDDAGLASGLFNTSQQIGGALGLAVLSTLANDRATGILADLGALPTVAQQQAAMVDGFQLAFGIAAGLLATGAIMVVALLRRRHVERIDAGEAEAVPVAA